MNQILWALCVLLPTVGVAAQPGDYFVAPDGNDRNSGSFEQPFGTIQRAVDALKPGGTCYLRGGIYRQSIDLSGKSGEADRPIRLTVHNDEIVTLDGTDLIDGSWTLDEGKVYKTTIKKDVTQLFVEGELMTLARFPNALAFSDKVWHRTAARCQKSRDSTNGHVIGTEVDEKSLAAAGHSFNGCVALLNFGAHATAARIVENHAVGSNEFSYSPKLYKYKTTLNYFLEGGIGNAERAMLDQPREWAYDETARTLYLWPEDGENPGRRQIRGKTRTYAISGDAGTKHVVIDGLHFFATTFSFERSDDVAIQNCRFDYYASSKRALGILGPSETAQFVGDPEDFCTNATIYNCEFRYADGSALIGSYVEGIRIENNLFTHIDYACVNNDVGKAGAGFQASSSIRMSKTRDLIYRRNTLSVSGNAQGIATDVFGVSGRRFSPVRHNSAAIRAPVFEYNLHTACGLLHTDGSSLYLAHGSVVESVARYNWFIGNGQRDFRWDGNNRPLQGVHGNVYRNVAVGTEIKRMSPSGGNGFRIKGSYHEVYHNLGLGRGGELNVATEKGGNAETITRNNVASHFTDQPIPGVSSNNYAGGKNRKRVHDMLRDPTNWDFRPRADAAELIDQGTPVTCSIRGHAVDVTAGYKGEAPDLGPYEYGDEVYWIPGRQTPQASMPIPKDKAVNVPLDADLAYLVGLNCTKANVHFGNDEDELKLIATQDSPRNLVSLRGKHALLPNTTYYWLVESVRPDGSSISGDVWSFTTLAESP